MHSSIVQMRLWQRLWRLFRWVSISCFSHNSGIAFARKLAMSILNKVEFGFPYLASFSHNTSLLFGDQALLTISPIKEDDMAISCTPLGWTLEKTIAVHCNYVGFLVVPFFNTSDNWYKTVWVSVQCVFKAQSEEIFLAENLANLANLANVLKFVLLLPLAPQFANLSQSLTSSALLSHWTFKVTFLHFEIGYPIYWCFLYWIDSSSLGLNYMPEWPSHMPQ